MFSDSLIHLDVYTFRCWHSHK